MPQSLEDLFIVHKEAKETKHILEPNGPLVIAACSSGIDFAEKIKTDYEDMSQKKGEPLQVSFIKTFKDQEKNHEMTIRFEDSETCVRLPRGLEGHIAGADVYVVQCVHEKISGRSANENLMELYQMLRTFKVHRARNITVVLPYHPYSRQDKTTFLEREASLAKHAADLMIKSGVNGVLTYHLHTDSIRGFYEPDAHIVPLTGLDLFLDIFSESKGKSEVVAVSPDAGGTKFTLKFSEMMDLDPAVMNKYRKRKDEASLLGVVGALDGKKIAIVIDDETVTGTSLINAGKALKENYNINETHVGISHFKINKDRIPNLIEAHEKGYITTLNVTDSIPQPQYVRELPFIKTYSISNRFAIAINRLHYNQSVKAILQRR